MADPSQRDPSEAVPVPYLSTDVSDRLIQQTLDTYNREGLTSEQARQVLNRIGHLLDLGELIARQSSH